MIQVGKDGYYVVSPSVIAELKELLGTAKIDQKKINKLREEIVRAN